MKRPAILLFCGLATACLAAHWQYLSGGKLSGISSVGSFVWAVGQDGLMFVSGDNGRYWRRIPRFTTRNLVDVEFWDQSFGLITAEGDIVYRTTDNGATWDSSYVQYIGGRIRFANEDCIWITRSSSDGFLSVDAGRSWTHKTGLGVSPWFLDSLRGWCEGAYDTVLRTSNSGTTWAKVGRMALSGYNCGLYCFGFADSSNGVCSWGFMSGSPSNPYFVYGWSVTGDGGATWDELTHYATPGIACDIGPDGLLYGLETKGCMTLGSAGFHRVALPEPYAFRDVSAAHGDRAWICGDGGAIWSSLDSGASWASARPQSIDLLQNVDFSDTLRGWGASSDWAARTTDGGRSWIPAPIGFGISPITDIVALDETTSVTTAGWSYYDLWYGWIGFFGLARTTNAGTTWDTAGFVGFVGGDGPVGSSRFARVGKHLWHPGVRAPNGNSLRSTDGGATWLDMDTLGAVGDGEPFDVSFVDTLNGWVIDSRTNIRHTTDGGDSWTICAVTLNVKRLEMTSLTEGWAMSDSELFHTTDGGTNWSSAMTQSGLQTMGFCDTRHGAIVGLNGLILRTDDGGATWVRDSSAFTSDLHAVCVLDSGHMWASGENGLVLGFGDWASDVAESDFSQPAIRYSSRPAVRPNPCRDHAAVALCSPAVANLQLRLLDVSGRVVRQIQVPSGERSANLDLRALPAGVYFVGQTDLPTAGRVRLVKLQ